MSHWALADAMSLLAASARHSSRSLRNATASCLSGASAKGEAEPKFKVQLLKQAHAYRKLAAKRAELYGMPPPSGPNRSG